MADTKGNIKDPGKGQAVQSVTTEVPHPADADSAPGPYEGLELNRPPVSTNQPDVPIAHSLVAGAGAPSPDAQERMDEQEKAAEAGPETVEITDTTETKVTKK